MNGVLVIDKPSGWTSHDVVAKVKRTLGASKVGHLGTLDPLATGVLPLVVDGATKYALLLEGLAKVYETTMKLGERTDTFDSEGTVTESAAFAHLAEEDIRAAFAPFMGRIMQLPPMYSSVKQKGVPLYKLARKGVVVEREAKEVEITGLDVSRVDLPYVSFTVGCTRGTYVRSICNDVGDSLGCGAHLTGLRRLVSGVFTIGEAVPAASGRETLEGAMIPLNAALGRALAGLRTVAVTDAEAARMKNSATIMTGESGGFFAFNKPGEMVKFSHSGRIVAVAETVSADPGRTGAIFRVIKVLKGSVTVPADAADEQKNQLNESVC